MRGRMIFTPAGVSSGSLLGGDPQENGTPGLRAEAIAPQPIRRGGGEKGWSAVKVKGRGAMLPRGEGRVLVC